LAKTLTLGRGNKHHNVNIITYVQDILSRTFETFCVSMSWSIYLHAQ